MLENLYTTKMSADKKKLQDRFLKIRTKDSGFYKTVAIISGAVLLALLVTVSVILGSIYGFTKNDNNMKVTIKGEVIELKNKPILKGQSIYLPLREMCDAVNPALDMGETDDEILIYGKEKYKLTIGEKKIEYLGEVDLPNSRAVRETKEAPISKRGIVYVPYDYIKYIFNDSCGYNVNGTFPYKNERMNIAFDVPFNWYGKYTVEESEDYVCFLQTADRKAMFDIRKVYDEEAEKIMRNTPDQTVLWQNEEYAYILGRNRENIYPIYGELNKEEIAIADEYEELCREIEVVENTFSLIEEVAVPEIENAEGMRYMDIRDLQRQVDLGHHPWRMDAATVILSYISGGEKKAIAGGDITALAGDGEKCSATYTKDGVNYIIELYKPLDKTEHGAWIVKSFGLADEYENTKLVWPVPATRKIAMNYGIFKNPVTNEITEHNGIDIIGEAGDVVVSATNGEVTEAGFDDKKGNYIVIYDGNKVKTVYEHLSTVDVAEGEKVKAGQEIGIVGKTGDATGIHLHFELLINDKPCNPEMFW